MEDVHNKKIIVGTGMLLDMLQDGDSINIAISGASMLPFIVEETDRIMLVRANLDSLKKGDIVVAQVQNDVYFLHRIVRISKEEVVLRGDGNLYSKETCHISSVLAKAVAIDKGGKVYTSHSLLWKAMARFWPANPVLRRIALAIYRRM